MSPKTTPSAPRESTRRRRPRGAPLARSRCSSAAPSLTNLLRALQLDLRAELHHAIRRYAEVGRGALRVAREEGEQRLAPAAHARPSRRDQLLSAHEIADLGEVDRQAPELDLFEQRRHVGYLHESVARDDSAEALAERLHGDALA